MQTGSKKCTEWLAPLPEEEYLRIVYVGKLQILPSKMSNGGEQGNSPTRVQDISPTMLEHMINDIWKVSSVWNCTHGISGHLGYTKGLHISQLIEGKAEEATYLMAKIRKDPRVVVYREFRRRLNTMNPGWNISMCYSFELTNEQYQLIADEDITLEQMFNSMKNTYEIRREGWKLREFYKTIVDTFLLKYISIEDRAQFTRLRNCIQ